MTKEARRIAVFGATGSIGTTALEIMEENSRAFAPVFLSCLNRTSELIAVLRRLESKGNLELIQAVCVGSEDGAVAVSEAFPQGGFEIYIGDDGLVRAAKDLEYDVMLNALVGIAGLAPTLAAIENGRRRMAADFPWGEGSEHATQEFVTADINTPPRFEIALANKETLVTGGALVMQKAKEAGVTIIPVDSEHSAIFQCLMGNAENEINRVIITASGGPFLGFSRAELDRVTPAQALAHPNWSMGPKISVDSATMMNKAFEMIEAMWLFSLPPWKIEAVIHPGSTVHSFVEFEDGAMLAQLGVPSMKVPISYALSYPRRITTYAGCLDLVALGRLEFAAPSGEGKRAIDLAQRLMGEAEDGDGSAAVFANGANEVLVAAFLAGRIPFSAIIDGVEDVCREVWSMTSANTFDGIMENDRQARSLAESFIERFV